VFSGHEHLDFRRSDCVGAGGFVLGRLWGLSKNAPQASLASGDRQAGRSSFDPPGGEPPPPAGDYLPASTKLSATEFMQ